MTDVPGDNVQTTSAFGESEFGNRLEYSGSGGGCCADWRDKGWAIFYYIHVALMCSLAIALPLVAGNDNSSSNAGGTPSPTMAPTDSIPYETTYIKVTGIIIIILIQCIVGAIWGLVWLKIIQHFASLVIKVALFMVMALWLGVAVMGFVIGLPAGGGHVAWGIIFFLLNALYTWCIWNRIPFSSILLTIASTITQAFNGTICISLLMIPANMIWYFIWTFSAYGFIEDVIIPQKITSTGLIYFIIFLLLLSLYWGLQVNKNISHTTTCGVTATWYYSKEVHKPTIPALKRTLTTSFGSVCFGSFIVAVLQAIRAILRSQRRNSILACIVYCLLTCIERLIRYFNMYAFAQVAIYGTNFITSAKATWGLFSSKGFEMIINDDLTWIALVFGSLLAFVISFFTAWFMVPIWYPQQANIVTGVYYYYAFWFIIVLKVAVGFVGGILSYYLCITVLMVVRSSVVTLFVCFAEDPAALSQNRPESYNALIGGKQPLQVYAQTGHTGLSAENEQQQQQQTQQQ